MDEVEVEERGVVEEHGVVEVEERGMVVVEVRSEPWSRSRSTA